MPRLVDAIRDDDAATLVEYGVLLSVIALVAIVAIDLVGVNLASVFRTVADDVIKPNTLPH